MTPKERAMEVLKMPWRSDPDPYSPGRREFLLHEELEQRLEQAIIAAIEEAKAEQASVTAKAEREECLKILQKTYQEWVDGDWAPGEAFESARDRIRARGD